MQHYSLLHKEGERSRRNYSYGDGSYSRKTTKENEVQISMLTSADFSQLKADSVEYCCGDKERCKLGLALAAVRTRSFWS